jgi:LysM repeat protein
MRSFLNYLMLILIILALASLDRSAAQAQAGDPWSLVAEVNSLRSSYSLPAYEVNNALMSAAQKHSDYQAQIGTWTHTGPGGSRPHDRAVAAGYGGGAQVYVSENVALGVNLGPQKTVFELWQDAIHLETMISSRYTDIGAGVSIADGTVYYTIDVGYIAGAPGNGIPTPDEFEPTEEAGTPAPTPIPVEPIQVATPKADGSVVHVVQWGQFLENIAKTYDVALQDLMAINGLSQETILYPGDKLLISAGQTPQSLLEEEVTSGTMAIEIETPTLIPTRIPRSATNTPTQVSSTAIAMDVPSKDFPTGTATRVADHIPVEKNQGADYLLFAVFGLALTGSAFILFGSALKKRS